MSRSGLQSLMHGALLCAMIAVPCVRAAAAQTVEWPVERPPRPLPARDVKFPPYEIRTLANGLQVVTVLHHEQPSVSIRLIARAGASQDPPGKAGVATMVAALLDQGTTTRSARKIAETIDDIGGGLGTGAGSDLTYINAVVMKDSFAFGMDLLADIARNPAFAPEELERQRQQMVPGMRVSYEDPDYIAGVVFDRLIYGFHPYGMPNSGTPATIAQLTREDLVAFHRSYFAPNNCVLAIVGDVTTDEAFDNAERAFGKWERRDVPTTTFADPPAATRRVIVIDKPGAVQTEIRVGHVAIPRKHPDYMALNLAIKILGGEGGNRLHRVLRSERSLTYGASADMETLKQSGSIVAETDTRSQASGEVLRLIVDEFWNLQRERVGERELSDAKAYLTGSFPLSIETPDAIATQVLNVVFYGLDVSELDTYRERVNAVTVDDIQRVAKQYLKPDRLSIVLVGDASSFDKDLATLGFDQVERVELADLDLSSVDFRKSGARAPVAAAPASAVAPGAPLARNVSLSQDDPAAARVLIRQAVDAKGGLEKLQAVKTVKAQATTTLTTPDGPVQAETLTYIQYPDRFRVEAKLPAGSVVQAFANGEGWIVSPSGVQPAPPPLVAEFRQSVARDVIPLLIGAVTGALNVKPLGEVAGDAGAKLSGVQISGKGLEPVDLFIDAATGLIAQERYQATGPAGPETTEEVFSDYRDVDGLKIAFKAQVRRAGTTIIERTVTEFQINADLDPALFQKPPR